MGDGVDGFAAIMLAIEVFGMTKAQGLSLGLLYCFVAVNSILSALAEVDAAV
jgi:hypothetical protein